jgi:hypothetical protein
MSKVNKISLFVAAAIFLIYILSYNSILGETGNFILLGTFFLFGWFDDNGYGSILGLDNPGFPLIPVMIMSVIFYIVSFIILSILRFVYIKIQNITAQNLK